MHKCAGKGHVSPHNAHTSLPLCPEKQAHRARKAYTYTKKKWHLEKGGIRLHDEYMYAKQEVQMFTKRKHVRLYKEVHSPIQRNHTFTQRNACSNNKIFLHQNPVVHALAQRNTNTHNKIFWH